jgi:hypothetical protein
MAHKCVLLYKVVLLFLFLDIYLIQIIYCFNCRYWNELKQHTLLSQTQAIESIIAARILSFCHYASLQLLLLQILFIINIKKLKLCVCVRAWACVIFSYMTHCGYCWFQYKIHPTDTYVKYTYIFTAYKT